MKVRGQRVELEEVETALKSCPGIAEAAVLLADDRDEAVLVAFLSHKVLRSVVKPGETLGMNNDEQVGTI